LDVQSSWGPASAAVVDGLRAFGLQEGEKRELRQFLPSELGSEHYLGLAAISKPREGHLECRGGVPLREYYLERCLLEAEAAGVYSRMEACCRSAFDSELLTKVVGKLFPRVVPDIRISVPTEELDVKVGAEPVQPESDVRLDVFAQLDLALAAVGIVRDIEDGVEPVPDWFDHGSGVHPSVEVGGGYCYLLLVDPTLAPWLGSVLGPSPGFGVLWSLPVQWLKPSCMWKNYSVEVSEGLLHVRFGRSFGVDSGGVGGTVLSQLRQYLQDQGTGLTGTPAGVRVGAFGDWFRSIPRKYSVEDAVVVQIENQRGLGGDTTLVDLGQG